MAERSFTSEVVTGSAEYIANSLHQRYANGLTPHYAMGVSIRDKDLADKAEFSWSSANAHTQDDLNRLREAPAGLFRFRRWRLVMRQHELASIDHSDWTPQWQERLIAQVQQLDRSAITLDQRLSDLLAALGFDIGFVNLGVCRRYRS